MATSATAAATYQNVSRRANEVNIASVRPQGVTGAADRTDQLGIEARVDLGAQIGNVRLDRTRPDVAVGPPHQVEQLVAGEHALGISHEREQQRVFARREFDALIAALDFTPV